MHNSSSILQVIDRKLTNSSFAFIIIILKTFALCRGIWTPVSHIKTQSVNNLKMNLLCFTKSFFSSLFLPAFHRVDISVFYCKFLSTFLYPEPFAFKLSLRFSANATFNLIYWSFGNARVKISFFETFHEHCWCCQCAMNTTAAGDLTSSGPQ